MCASSKKSGKNGICARGNVTPICVTRASSVSVGSGVGSAVGSGVDPGVGSGVSSGVGSGVGPGVSSGVGFTVKVNKEKSD